MKHLPYERQGLSQHAESGIIEFLLAGIHQPRKNFVEIGFGTGTQNMTLDLLAKGYSGIGIDGRDWDPSVDQRWPDQLTKIQQMITPDSILNFIPENLRQPDFFSIDIDSFDYEVTKALLEAKFRPAVACCEINQYFGHEWGSFPYVENAIKKTYDRKFAYGCGLEKYNHLWATYGYEFFTIDTSAVNGFWIDPTQVVVDMTVPRHQDLHEVDTTVLKQQLAKHWYWQDKISTIYQK